MNTVMFSIVVPVYNQEKYLDECINSVLTQNYYDFELILVNDGSTDSSPDICDKYAEKDERIKVIHKENGGLPSARKAGAELACGDYIITLDSDDMLVSDSLQTISDIVSEYSPDIISCGFVKYFDTHEKFWHPYFDEGLYADKKLETIKNEFLFYNKAPFFTFGLAPGTWANITKKDLYIKHQTPVDNRIKLGEDMCVTFPAILDCKSLYVTKKGFIKYRILNTSMSHSFNPKDLDDLKNLISHYKKLNLDNQSAYNQLCVYILFRVYDSLAKSARNLTKYKQFLLYAKEIDEKIFNYINSIDKTSLDKKGKIALFLIKHKLWYAFWTIYNKK